MNDSYEELMLNWCSQAITLLPIEQQVVVIIMVLLCTYIKDHRKQHLL